MLRFCLPAIASLLLLGGLHAGETPAAPPPAGAPAAAGTVPGAAPPAATAGAASPAPEASLTQWVKALRGNDLAALYRALTSEQRRMSDNTWSIQAATPDADGDKQLNSGLGLLLSPTAVDLLVAQAEPDLATLNPQDLVIGLQQVGGFLALAGSQPKQPGDAPALDFIALQGFLADIGGWLPLAGINDAAKLRKAVEHVVAGARLLGVKNALEVRALKTEEVLHRLSAALAEVKAALLIYGLDANALLDSGSIAAAADGSGEQRSVTVGFTAFGHPHHIPVKMVRKEDAWTFAEGKDSPFAPLSQPDDDGHDDELRRQRCARAGAGARRPAQAQGRAQPATALGRGAGHQRRGPAPPAARPSRRQLRRSGSRWPRR